MAKGAFLELGNASTLPAEDVYEVYNPENFKVDATKLLDGSVKITVSFECPSGIFQDITIDEVMMQRICWPNMPPQIPNPPYPTNHVFLRAGNSGIGDNLKDWQVYAKKQDVHNPRPTTIVVRINFLDGKVNGALG